MKSIAALAFLAATVAAQSPEELRGQIPECALSCIEEAAGEAGCESGDFACECENQEDITNSASLCQVGLDEEERCSGDDLSRALSLADQICEAASSGDNEDDDSSATESGDASATETGDDAEETGDDAEESGTDDEEPSSTDSGDDAEESSAGDEGDDEGSDEGADGEGAATKLGSYGWAGAAAAAVALVF